MLKIGRITFEVDQMFTVTWFKHAKMLSEVKKTNCVPLLMFMLPIYNGKFTRILTFSENSFCAHSLPNLVTL